MSNKSRNYTKSKWYNKLKKSSPKCIYCGEILDENNFTVDHVIPRTKGGKDTPENCKPCCKFCNTLKADMELKEFNERYTKEKILKLKRFTDSSRKINESEMYQSINDRITKSFNTLQSIQDDYIEYESIVNTYKKLSDEVRKEMALEVNLNAADGYKLYRKMRDIERNIIRLKSEKAILQSFNAKYTSIRSKLLNLQDFMQLKESRILNKPYRPLLELDIRKQIENNLK